MQKPILWLLLALASLQFACSGRATSASYEKAGNIIRYLSEQQHLDISRKHTMVFIVTGACPGCTGAIGRLLSYLDADDTRYGMCEKVLVLGGSADTTAITALKLHHFTVKKDAHFSLERYGLIIDDLYVEFAPNGQSLYHANLSGKGINETASHYLR